ncbi:unnamed protein product [Thelazia callipaeda]|uniref:DNA 3'-5' helicase n=1 Tax=Thelazia callipaeda TaxID=103827 RepID=A0A0N5DBD5_THECL|nr:unnamed protein product [Thelazia callipaeda]
MVAICYRLHCYATMQAEKGFDMMDSTRSHESELCRELSELDEQLGNIDAQIHSLNAQRQLLLQRKNEIEKLITRRKVEKESALGIWDSDKFDWIQECRLALHSIFKLDEFRSLQRAVINAVLSKKDCLVVMSTGSGKSLCYQLPAVVMKGIVLVVSPLVAFVEDQLHQLNKLGIDAAALNQWTPKN